MAPSHYLNQCCIITNDVLLHSLGGISIGNAQNIHHRYLFEKYWFKITIASLRGQWVNSLRQSDAYMRQYNIVTLLQIMACHLFSAKPLSEPMHSYCQLDTKEHISVNFYSRFKSFHSVKCTWKCRLRNGGHFISASMYWICCCYPSCNRMTIISCQFTAEDIKNCYKQLYMLHQLIILCN